VGAGNLRHHRHHPAMRCTLDLPPQAAPKLEALAERLHHPSRDALLGWLVVQGLAAVTAQLREGAAVELP